MKYHIILNIFKNRKDQIEKRERERHRLGPRLEIRSGARYLEAGVINGEKCRRVSTMYADAVY